ncbi:MAG: SYNERG-CTERM sorting domain-containing protein, partial [Synergistaceae bacterium]|nr:SYNERG-CTERM sorting domain-containing protein [Synergistaceae bacterium]
LIVQDDTRVPVALQAGALSATRAEALSKTAVRVYDLIDYTGLGSGEANKDKRLVLQIDTTSIASLIYDNWIKLLESTTAVNFSNLHYLTSSDVDLAKVSLTTTAGQSLAGTYDVEVVLDESSRAILAHISRQPSGPVSGDIPPEIPDTTETVTTPVAGSTGGEWRLTLTPPSGATIPNHTPFYVWFMVVNSSVNRAANSILRPYSDDDFFGPFVTESVVDAAGNTVLEVDVDNLKNPDGTQGILPAGSYKIRYADSATRETFVGTTSGTLTTQGTTQNSPDSGSGGCNAGFGSTLMLAAIIPAINAIKRKKK